MNLGSEDSEALPYRSDDISNTMLTLTRSLVIFPSSHNQGSGWHWGAQGDGRRFSNSTYNCHKG